MSKLNNPPPPWTEAPTWAKYIGQQPNGHWYAFSHKPLKTRTGFSYGHELGVNGKYAFFISKSKPNPNWRDTLKERPKDE